MLEAKSCTDPIVGAILSGWRYDISSISPDMRTDYEQHLAECPNCRHRQRKARTLDLLLIFSFSLSIVAFMLAAVVLRRLELLTHIAGNLTLHLHDTPIVISLQAVAMAGLFISMVLWVLVAIATPLPSLVQQIPSGIRQRLARRHA
jgi:hypothetical protein